MRSTQLPLVLARRGGRAASAPGRVEAVMSSPPLPHEARVAPRPARLPISKRPEPCISSWLRGEGLAPRPRSCRIERGSGTAQRYGSTLEPRSSHPAPAHEHTRGGPGSRFRARGRTRAPAPRRSGPEQGRERTLEPQLAGDVEGQRGGIRESCNSQPRKHSPDQTRVVTASIHNPLRPRP